MKYEQRQDRSTKGATRGLGDRRNGGILGFSVVDRWHARIESSDVGVVRFDRTGGVHLGLLDDFSDLACASGQTGVAGC